MSVNDELPNWTGGHQPGSALPGEPPKRRSRGALFALLGLLALIGMGTIGYFVAQNQADSDTETTADPASPTAEDDSTADDDQNGEADGDESAMTGAVDSSETDEDVDSNESATEDGDTTGTEDSDQAADGTDGTTDDVDDTDDDAAAGSDDSGRTAVFRAGKLYLGGKVPSQDVADFIAERAMAVVGPDNVVVEYEIDPSVVIDPGESTPLYVEDVVLFQFNSIAIDPPFVPLLDLGTLLLSQNPQATLTVVTRTDAVGSEEINLDVARKRANAVMNYWLSQGVKADQLKADPRGEEGTSDDDDEQTAALQRRAEFVITGLLDG